MFGPTSVTRRVLGPRHSRSFSSRRVGVYSLRRPRRKGAFVPSWVRSVMTNYWILQGNPKKWDRPDKLFSEPILGWSVTGIEDKVDVGDGVLIWMANARPALRGLHAAGKVSGHPRNGYPLGWGDER